MRAFGIKRRKSAYSGLIYVWGILDRIVAQNAVDRRFIRNVRSCQLLLAIILTYMRLDSLGLQQILLFQ